MNRWLVSTLAVACLVLAVFDVLLIRRVHGLEEEKGMLQLKVLPSLQEQYDLFEHGLEGDDLGELFDTLAATAPGFRELIDEPAAGHLLIYVPGENCRRALHSEMQVFGAYRDGLKARRVRPIFIFAGFAQDDLDALTHQFGISEASVTDPQRVLRQRFGLRGEPVALLVDGERRIRYANVVRSGAEEASRRLYEKVDLLAGEASGS